MRKLYISLIFIIMVVIFAAGLTQHSDAAKASGSSGVIVQPINVWIANDSSLLRKKLVEFERERLEREQKALLLLAEKQRLDMQSRSYNVSTTVPVGNVADASTGFIEYNGHLCLGDCILSSAPCVIPQYICNREAMYINEINGQRLSNSCGKYQFLGSTWNNYRGYPNACSAPESVQDAKAAELWDNGRGCSHWSAC